MKQVKRFVTSEKERALLVQVIYGNQDKGEAADSLEELERLADTAGAEIAGSITQRREKPNPAFFVGEGKLNDIQLACRQGNANLIIFDNELSPVQVNNLDLALGIKVIDRTELILQIFARRASSAESQMQVEIAQLEYLSSRVPVSKKQARFSGGIGMKGPGESPLELRNEPMRRRVRELKKKLKHISDQRKRTREKRPWPVVCLVGYTNAGKSTLLNALASANAYVDDRLFSTLDTKTRLVKINSGRKALLTDTVGFIRRLPHGLVASFRSTLEVVAEADLLLKTADASHDRLADHIAVIEETLNEIEASGVPSILLLNKSDEARAKGVYEEVRAKYPDALIISARDGEGLDLLKEKINEVVSALPEFKAAPVASLDVAWRSNDRQESC